MCLFLLKTDLIHISGFNAISKHWRIANRETINGNTSFRNSYQNRRECKQQGENQPKQWLPNPFILRLSLIKCFQGSFLLLIKKLSKTDFD